MTDDDVNDVIDAVNKLTDAYRAPKGIADELRDPVNVLH
jgi:hypothetical protein